jgi:hypothetical protein
LTLLLVPVIYAIFVLDLRFVPWEGHKAEVGDDRLAAKPQLAEAE